MGEEDPVGVEGGAVVGRVGCLDLRGHDEGHIGYSRLDLEIASE